jgi:uncharacterized protein (DUF697 family)
MGAIRMGEEMSGFVRSFVETLVSDAGWVAGGRVSAHGMASTWDENGYSGIDPGGEKTLALCSRDEFLLRRFLAALRRQPLLAPTMNEVRHEGCFTLIWVGARGRTEVGADAQEGITAEDLPPWQVDDVAAPDGIATDDVPPWEVDDADSIVRNAIRSAVCALFLTSANDGWEAADFHTYSRLRSAGPSMLPVIVYSSADERDAPETAGLIRQLHHSLGVRPATVAVEEGTGSVQTGVGFDDLALRILAYSPELAGVLGSEAPHLRRQVSADAIRSAVWLATCVGLEPAPLVDVPVQLFVQRRMGHAIAAIYGQPRPGLLRSEGIGLLTAGLALRYAIQQVVRLTPGVGWLLSAALSGFSTWLLGHSLVLYYDMTPAPPPIDIAKMACQARRTVAPTIDRGVQRISSICGAFVRRHRRFAGSRWFSGAKSHWRGAPAARKQADAPAGEIPLMLPTYGCPTEKEQ